MRFRRPEWKTEKDRHCSGRTFWSAIKMTPRCWMRDTPKRRSPPHSALTSQPIELTTNVANPASSPCRSASRAEGHWDHGAETPPCVAVVVHLDLDRVISQLPFISSLKLDPIILCNRPTGHSPKLNLAFSFSQIGLACSGCPIMWISSTWHANIAITFPSRQNGKTPGISAHSQAPMDLALLERQSGAFRQTKTTLDKLHQISTCYAVCPRTIAQSLDIPYRNGHQYHSLGVQVLTLKERPTDVPKEHLPSKLRRKERQQVVCQQNCCGCSGFIFYSIHKDQKKADWKFPKKTARIKTASAKKTWHNLSSMDSICDHCNKHVRLCLHVS